MRDILGEYFFLLSQFLDDTVSSKAFQDAYLEKFKSEDRLDEPLFEVLDELFGDVDSYTTDQQLLDERPKFYLDEAQLREKVRNALNRLSALKGDTKLRCRVCGFKAEDPPWGQDGSSPLYDFCPCCGVEHGYQDSSPAGARTYRAEWLRSGAKWKEPAEEPEGWDVNEQFHHIPPEFR